MAILIFPIDFKYFIPYEETALYIHMYTLKNGMRNASSHVNIM